MRNFARSAAWCCGLVATGMVWAQTSRSVLDGAYSDRQADRGKSLYAQHCGACHGTALTGGETAPPLAGGEFLANWNGLTVGDLVERMRTTMPFEAPGSLSRDINTDIATYILRFNRYPAGSTDLDRRLEMQKQIRIEPGKETAPEAAGPNSQGNPYRTVEGFFKLPEGRPWGSTSAVFVARNGHIWIAERCGANSCAGKAEPPVLEFDATGKLLQAFGSGLFVFPHGIYVDGEGNVWVVDGQGREGIGHQVIKFSPEGKVLMTLGKAGVAGDAPGLFNQPNAVIVAPNGDIFVAEGHSIGTGSARIQKFTREGKFILQWGAHGSGPGQFEMPHTMAFDSKGRLVVGDRGNDRLQVFDLSGEYLAEFKQFGRPSGLWIDKNDTVYVADSESREKAGYGHHPGWKRGIRVGNLVDGTVSAFIPDTAPDPENASTTGAEGVAVDSAGNIFGAEVGQKGVKKYVK